MVSENNILFIQRFTDSSYKNYFMGWNKAWEAYNEVMKEIENKKSSKKISKNK